MPARNNPLKADNGSRGGGGGGEGRPGETEEPSRLPPGLLSQAEAADDREVPSAVLVAQVVEQARALADHHEEAAPGGVVLLVGAQVLGELGDALGEQC